MIFGAARRLGTRTRPCAGQRSACTRRGAGQSARATGL